ncbi:MAG: hypothetical protein II705_06180, partial [Clostridia bacterium]|nr:hypothetical protein [Clostridia bacterium]
ETRTGRGIKVNLKKLCEYVNREFKSVNTNYEEVYKKLANLPKETVAHIGPVYILTLVSFISRGLFPIYDIFAQRALNAIKLGKAPGSSVLDGNAGGKLIQNLQKDNVEKVLSLYNDYIKGIETVFKDSYNHNRNVDRALWVYGHLFIPESTKGD